MNRDDRRKKLAIGEERLIKKNEFAVLISFASTKRNICKSFSVILVKLSKQKVEVSH